MGVIKRISREEHASEFLKKFKVNKRGKSKQILKPKKSISPADLERLRLIQEKLSTINVSDLQIPTLSEMLERITKDNETRGISNKDNEHLESLPLPQKTKEMPLPEEHKPREISQIRDEKYNAYLRKKIVANEKYINLKDTVTNRRLINVLAENYHATIGDALEISNLLLHLNPAQISGAIYYIENTKMPVIKLKKKLTLLADHCMIVNEMKEIKAKQQNK